MFTGDFRAQREGLILFPFLCRIAGFPFGTFVSQLLLPIYLIECVICRASAVTFKLISSSNVSFYVPRASSRYLRCSGQCCFTRALKAARRFYVSTVCIYTEVRS